MTKTCSSPLGSLLGRGGAVSDFGSAPRKKVEGDVLHQPLEWQSETWWGGWVLNTCLLDSSLRALLIVARGGHSKCASSLARKKFSLVDNASLLLPFYR